MDTTHRTHPPPPPPPPARAPTAWWRPPLADLVDLLGLAVTGAAAGAAVAGLVTLDTRADDPWAGLVAVLLGLGAAAVTTFVVWIVLLVRVHTGKPTPGHRLAECAVERGAAAVAGAHVALVVAGWALVVAAAGLTEPPPDGLVGGAIGSGVAAGALVLAHGWGAPSTRVGIVIGAMVVGGVVAGAVPDRAPYSWEVRDAVHEAMVAELARDPAATRDCAPTGAAGIPLASHATDSCTRSDPVWTVPRPPAAVADVLAVTAQRVAAPALVAVDHRVDELAVTIDGDPVAIVSAAGVRCGTSRIVLDRYDVRPDAGQSQVCR